MARIPLHKPLLSLAGILLVCCLAACGGGTRLVVLGTAQAPSTSGIVEVVDIDAGTALVTIHLEHLHPPKRLDDSFTSYVVWFEGEGTAIRAGLLTYDADNRTGDLSGTSSLRKFTLKITAEKEPNVSKPGEFVIATQEITVD